MRHRSELSHVFDIVTWMRNYAIPDLSSDEANGLSCVCHKRKFYKGPGEMKFIKCHIF